MKEKIYNFRFSIFNYTVCLTGLFCWVSFSGCGIPRHETTPLCPGKTTAAEVIAALRDKQTASLSLVCAVDCKLEFTDPDGKPKKETFGGKLFFIDPEKLCIGGEKFGPIRIGVNAEEFWMYFKPIDTAWFGLRSNTSDCADKSGFNPSSMVYLTEAFGRIDRNADWTLTNDPGYDLLTAVNGRGVKRVYINCCTNQIERIEYCDQVRNQVILVASADLSDYKTIDGVGEVPSVIQLRHFRFGQTDTMFQLKLSAIKAFIPTAVQQEKLFVRPEPKGYEKIFRLNNQCDFIRE